MRCICIIKMSTSVSCLPLLLGNRSWEHAKNGKCFLVHFFSLVFFPLLAKLNPDMHSEGNFCRHEQQWKMHCTIIGFHITNQITLIPFANDTGVHVNHTPKSHFGGLVRSLVQKADSSPSAFQSGGVYTGHLISLNQCHCKLFVNTFNKWRVALQLYTNSKKFGHIIITIIHILES